MKTIYLSEEKANALWEQVQFISKLPNVVVSICVPEISMTDEYTREEFFKAITSEWVSESQP